MLAGRTCRPGLPVHVRMRRGSSGAAASDWPRAESTFLEGMQSEASVSWRPVEMTEYHDCLPAGMPRRTGGARVGGFTLVVGTGPPRYASLRVMESIGKIQCTLAVLWLATFIAGPSVWLWMFVNNSTPGYNGIHAVHSVVCLFGAVACVSLFRGAKWALIAIGIIAIYFALGTFFGEIVRYGWMRVDKLGDGALFVLSMVTIVLLFFRRYPPVQSPPPERTAAAA